MRPLHRFAVPFPRSVPFGGGAGARSSPAARGRWIGAPAPRRRRRPLASPWALLAAVLALLLSATLAHAAPKFPPLTGRVVDEAHLLSPAAQQAWGRIDMQLEKLRLAFGENR